MVGGLALACFWDIFHFIIAYWLRLCKGAVRNYLLFCLGLFYGCLLGFSMEITGNIVNFV